MECHAQTSDGLDGRHPFPSLQSIFPHDDLLETPSQVLFGYLLLLIHLFACFGRLAKACRLRRTWLAPIRQIYCVLFNFNLSGRSTIANLRMPHKILADPRACSLSKLLGKSSFSYVSARQIFVVLSQLSPSSRRLLLSALNAFQGSIRDLCCSNPTFVACFSRNTSCFCDDAGVRRITSLLSFYSSPPSVACHLSKTSDASPNMLFAWPLNRALSSGLNSS